VVIVPAGLRSGPTLPASIRLTVILLLFLLGAAAMAQERILSFDSDITVNSDGSLDVVETIVVNAEGQQIRRGIFRDFPTRYKDRFNNNVVVDFDVVAVTRNGEPERYALEAMRNGVRIRIGNANVMLPRGEHTYRISYRTNRQLGFFDDFDELYWNVTGTGWQFTIESAAANVTLPAGAEVLRKAAFTGRTGERGTDYRPVAGPDGPGWQTTRALRPGEGLTIAVSWPAGIIAAPGFTDRLRWFVRDNRTTGTALLGTLAVLAYYFAMWRRYGRDPEAGPVIPRFEPPKGLSPAACRFIRLMNYDRKAFSAALMHMAVKGYLLIEESGKKFTLTRQREPGRLEGLSGGERRIAKHLTETRDTVVIKHENNALLRGAIKKLRGSLEAEYELATFKRNTGFIVIGLVLSAGVAVASDAFFLGVIVALVAAALTFAGFHLWGDDADPSFKVIPFRSLPAVGSAADFLKLLFFFAVVFASSSGAILTQISIKPFMIACFALLGAANTLFFFLLKRPTNAGKQLMNEIEGFRMYLKTAEENRLQFLHPPEKTPELFERFLPYAIALDVENEWADKFAAVLAAASREPGQAGGYEPRWYRSSRSLSVKRIGSVGTSLGGVVAAAARPPGSSSGSGGFSGGGGGFSGGGGGGGGGGGW